MCCGFFVGGISCGLCFVGFVEIVVVVWLMVGCCIFL